MDGMDYTKVIKGGEIIEIPNDEENAQDGMANEVG